MIGERGHAFDDLHRREVPGEAREANQWEALARQYARDVNSEEGCLFYTWHRTVDDPNEWVCVEGFRDQDAAVAHVNSAAFKNMVEVAPDLVASQPLIINTTIEQNDWGPMGEISPRRVLIKAWRAPPGAPACARPG